MNEIPDPRFELTRITRTEWLIHDLKYRENDPRRVIACIYEYSGVEVEVIWLRDLPLAAWYTTPFDALDEVRRMYAKDLAPVTAPLPVIAPAPALAAG